MNRMFSFVVALAVSQLVINLAQAQIKITPMHRIDTKDVEDMDYKIHRSKGVSARVVLYTTEKQLELWNLKDEKKEKSVDLKGLVPSITIRDIYERKGGDLVVSIVEHTGQGKFNFHLAEFSSGKVHFVGSGNSGISQSLLKLANGDQLLGISLSSSDEEKKTDDVNVVWNLEKMKSIALVETDFSADIHLFETKAGITAVLGGYEVLAIWNIAGIKVEKIVEREQPSQWPRFIGDGEKRTYLLMEKLGEKKISALYDIASLLAGELKSVRVLSANESLSTGLNDKLVLQSAKGRITTFSYLESGKVFAQVETGFPVAEVNYLQQKNGDVLTSVLYREFYPNGQSVDSIRFMNLTQKKTLSEFKNLTESEFSQFLFGKNDALLSSLSLGGVVDDNGMYVHPRMMVVDAITGKEISHPDASHALTPLFATKDGRILSIFADPKSGNAKLVNWLGNKDSASFPEGTFLPNFHPSITRRHVLGGGVTEYEEEFIIPILKRDTMKHWVSGFRTFKIE